MPRYFTVKSLNEYNLFIILSNSKLIIPCLTCSPSIKSRMYFVFLKLLSPIAFISLPFSNNLTSLGSYLIYSNLLCRIFPQHIVMLLDLLR